MKYSAYSNVGGRGNNEDNFDISEAGGCYLFVLADGLGGIEAGEVASSTAVNEIKEQFLFDPKGFEPGRAIEAANGCITDIQSSTGKKMKTTVCTVYIADSDIYCSHVGDSRIYLFGENGIVYQSVDHSASQMAVFAGEITASEIRTHCDRNVLTAALGVAGDVNAQVKVFPADNIKAVLMASDGFWEYVYEEEMTETLASSSDAEEWLDKMRGLLQTRVKKNNDNNTAVAVLL